MMAAQWVVGLSAMYFGVGLLFAIAFVTWGVTRVDHAARGSRWTFRMLIVPGVAMLWTMMAARWARSTKKGHE